MSASISRSTRPRARRAIRCAGWLVSGVLVAHGGGIERADAATAFDVHASISRRPATQTNGGFALDARPVFQRKSASGGSYEIHAVVQRAPLACAADLVFENGFD